MSDFEAISASWSQVVSEAAQSDPMIGGKTSRPGRRVVARQDPAQDVSTVAPTVPPADEINALVAGVMDFGTGIADVSAYTSDEKVRMGNATYPVVVKYPWIFTNAPEVFLAITALALVTPKVLEFQAKQKTDTPVQPIKVGKLKKL